MRGGFPWNRRCRAIAEPPVADLPFAAPARLAMRTLLFALGSLPFLVPLHLRPITSFYGEWLAGMLAVILFAVTLATRRGRALPLPWMLLLPACLLAVIGIQLALGRIHFPQQALIHASYLLLAGIAMIAGRVAVEDLGVTPATLALAGGLATGALLQAAIGALQIQDVVISGWTTPLDSGHRVYGNLGQYNLLADYLWLGLVALVLLHARRAIGATSLLAGTLALLVAAPLTGSRSALLYPLVAGLVGMLMLRRSAHDTAALRAARRLAAMAPIALAIALATGALTARIQPDGGDSAGRFMSDATTPGSESIRVALLRTGIAATRAAPWLGSGVGAVPLQTLEHAPRGPDSVAYGVAEHLHNLPLNWMVEFGVPATLVALALTAGLLLALVRAPASAEGHWALAVLAIVGAHGMLEYPLWHAFFLVPVALIAGAGSPSRAALRLRAPMLMALGVAVALGLNLLAQLRADHAALARVSHLAPAGPRAEEIWRRHVEDLLLIHRSSLFSPYVAGMLAVTFDIDRERLPEKAALCAAAIHFSPAPEVLFKCAMVDALGGDAERARHRLRLAVAAFPAEAKGWRQRLAPLSGDYPELRALETLLPGPETARER